MSKRLLLADDSVTIQKVIGITFANEDYQLDIVDNGDSALEHAQNQRPDLVLADVYMPGKNGYELCAALKQDAALADVPVMLLTGTFEAFDEDKARQAGADAWISKPFESQYLIDQVEELLAKSDAAEASAPAAEEPAEQPAEEAAEEAGATPAADSWGDLADEDDLLFEEDAASEEAPVGEAAEEDIWGAVALDEDDLLLEDEPAADAPAAAPVSPAATAAPGAEEDAWGEIDDEIFDLEDDDIIDEVDLLDDVEDELESPVSETAEPEEAAVFTAEDDLLAEEPLATEETPASGGWSVPGVEMPEIQPVPVAEPEPEPEPEPESVDEAAAAAAPQTQPAAGGDVTLDEEQVAQIVERVAREVVERLAANLLERVAWEVVPDLAESLIKDEIRKIKANLQ